MTDPVPKQSVPKPKSGSTPRARRLRRSSTVPERILWGSLRRKQFRGLKFRRQAPIGRYVADFFCAEARLVIELDGESHVGRGVKDKARTAELEASGLKVIRFGNDDVLRHLDAVLMSIDRVAADRISMLV
ncbi:MAG: DUF559 domain-containing protein [Planctomycetota bacterium]